MRVLVQDKNGASHPLQLDEEILARHEADPALPPACEGIFTCEARVLDVWRYTVEVGPGGAVALIAHESGTVNGSQFADRPAADALAEETAAPVLLLLLESPHTAEYRFEADRLIPRVPAQGTSPGDAGEAIRRYLHIVVGKLTLPVGCYRLVIANPVQYQCSLGQWYGKMRPVIRNHVWRQIWSLAFIQC
ncbi:hypothetical protein [Stigmatella aurantiaca]|uniref:Uncharacterized protein n=1 Tax=Stigmatella aurantiaca (strain DW4/3-1) TaxID=378806 RepID=E3FGC4_STIAD|nr:hypothetical protein [Stigmatella aurantiaca]ADO70259.1 uncharacterized protein STAUR_2455 [Stigmatella aurantiaca DW4/3-1]